MELLFLECDPFLFSPPSEYFIMHIFDSLSLGWGFGGLLFFVSVMGGGDVQT